MASAREFAGKIVRRWYAFGVGVIGGLLGLASSLYAQGNPRAAPLVPLWLWLTLLAGGFLVAIFRAFHDVRMERDAVRDEMERRFSALRNALRCMNVDHETLLRGADSAYGDAEVRLSLENRSATDELQWQLERVTVTAEGLRSADSDPVPKSGILVPREQVFIRCPLVRDVPLEWRSGTVTFTARYGHASGRLQFRQSWTYERDDSSQPFSVPGTLRWRLANDPPKVEDV